jgi:hypothetical protein
MTSLLTHGDDATHGYQSQLAYAMLDAVHFKEHIEGGTKEEWFISHQSTTWKPGTVTVDGPHIVWGTPPGQTGPV